MRLRTATLALLSLIALPAAGCGGANDETPVACLEGPEAYIRALASAPDEVKLDGEVSISDCLPESQKGGELATVGSAMVAAATELNVEALANPGEDANLQLGYLLGAAQRADDHTEGIHAELMRRLSVAARYTPEGPPPPAFTSTYRRGFDAGHQTG